MLVLSYVHCMLSVILTPTSYQEKKTINSEVSIWGGLLGLNTERYGASGHVVGDLIKRSSNTRGAPLGALRTPGQGRGGRPERLGCGEGGAPSRPRQGAYWRRDQRTVCASGGILLDVIGDGAPPGVTLTTRY